MQADPKTGSQILVPAFATLIRQKNTWILRDVWCPATATPAPDLAALRDQVLRLLPHIQIRTTSPASTLVNIQTVLWAATGAHRDLGTVTVVGQQVHLRLGFGNASWDFGDDTTDTTSTPGKAYNDVTDPCDTPQCPSYFGHTYAASGPMTIALAVAWHAQFSLDGRTWTDVDPGTLTGPTTTHLITVKQARGVLVPNPGG